MNKLTEIKTRKVKNTEQESSRAETEMVKEGTAGL